MKIDTIWIALIVVLCWSFIGEVFAESPTDVTEEEPEPNDAGGEIVSPNTKATATSAATADTNDKFAIYKRYIREENSTEAQLFCLRTYNGDLVKICKLNSTQNETLPSLTGWIGLRLSNNTFRWFNNNIAAEIMQCFSGSNPVQPHCQFDCIDQDPDVMHLSSIDKTCGACQEITVDFYACVRVTASPTLTNIAASSATATIQTETQQTSSSLANTDISSSIIVAASTSTTTSAATTTLHVTSAATTMLTTSQETTTSTSSTTSTTSATSKTSTTSENTSLMTTISNESTGVTTALPDNTTLLVKPTTMAAPASMSSIADETTKALKQTANTTVETWATTSKPTWAPTAPLTSDTCTRITRITTTPMLGITPTTSTSGVSSIVSSKTTKVLTAGILPTTSTPGVYSSVSPKTTEQEYANALNKVNMSKKDAVEKMANITEDFLAKNDTDFPAVVFVIFEEKLVAYAKENLNKQHNGNVSIKRKKFRILIKQVTTDAKKSHTFIRFPEEEIKDETREDQVKEPSDFIFIPLNFSVLNESSFFIGMLFQAPENTESFLSGSNQENPTKVNIESNIITAKVHPKPSGNLSNITFTLSHGYVSLDEADCAFINESTYDFSTVNCSVVSSDEGRTKCTCNHMTSFAVITKIKENEVGANHKKALSIITYIGLTLSLIGETLTVVSYVLLIGMNTEQAHLHTNLAFALGLAQIFFLVGMNVAANEIGCVLVTSLLHYFYLVTFCWLLVEGFHLYLMVVKVFTENTYLKFYYLFSWVTPLIIVGLALIAAAASSAGIYGYVSEANCWISYENKYIWFFLGPVLLICLANIVLLFLVVREMTRMNKTKDGAPSLQFRKSVKACLLLFPILGTTWAFSAVLMIQHSLAIEYIFTILNSLQGFFIFLFYVMRSSEIRGVLKQRKARWATSVDLSNQPTSIKKTNTSNKTHPTSMSSIKPILGNWIGLGNSARTPSLRGTPSPRETPSPRDSPSPRSSPSPRGSLSLRGSPSPRDSPPSHFKTPSPFTTPDPPDLFERPRLSSSYGKVNPILEITDAETTA